MTESKAQRPDYTIPMVVALLANYESLCEGYLPRTGEIDEICNRTKGISGRFVAAELKADIDRALNYLKGINGQFVTGRCSEYNVVQSGKVFSVEATNSCNFVVDGQCLIIMVRFLNGEK